MAEEPKPTLCPNCQQPAMRTGNKVTCEKCDAVFKITKEGSATVQNLGPIEDHEERLKKIEAKIFIEEPEPPEQQGDNDDEPELVPEPENDSEGQNGDILPR